jgi:hypothetical protein
MDSKLSKHRLKGIHSLPVYLREHTPSKKLFSSCQYFEFSC